MKAKFELKVKMKQLELEQDIKVLEKKVIGELMKEMM